MRELLAESKQEGRSEVDYDVFARWWTPKANGKDVFYKTPDALRSYANRFLRRSNEDDTLDIHKEVVAQFRSEVQKMQLDNAILVPSEPQPLLPPLLSGQLPLDQQQASSHELYSLPTNRPRARFRELPSSATPTRPLPGGPPGTGSSLSPPPDSTLPSLQAPEPSRRPKTSFARKRKRDSTTNNEAAPPDPSSSGPAPKRQRDRTNRSLDPEKRRNAPKVCRRCKGFGCLGQQDVRKCSNKSEGCTPCHRCNRRDCRQADGGKGKKCEYPEDL
jgi:hypothetical protein